MKAVSFLAACLFALPALAQVDCNAGLAPIDGGADSPLSARDFIKEIVANERLFVKALGSKGYTVEITIETLQGETVDGTFHRVSTIDFDASGARRETVAAGAVNTLQRFKPTDKDLSVLGDPMAFAFTADSFADRDIVYSGRQRQEEHNLAVFDILPRSDRTFGHAFGGRTWVRGGKTSIVKTCGRSADYPVGDMRFDVVRAQADDDNYFPVLVRGDENVAVDGQPVRVRVTVKFTDYKSR